MPKGLDILLTTQKTDDFGVILPVPRRRELLQRTWKENSFKKNNI